MLYYSIVSTFKESGLYNQGFPVASVLAFNSYFIINNKKKKKIVIQSTQF